MALRKRQRPLSEQIADYLVELSDQPCVTYEELTKRFYKTVSPGTKRLLIGQLRGAKKNLALRNHGEIGQLVIPVSEEKNGKKIRVGVKCACPGVDEAEVEKDMNRSKSMALGFAESFQRKARVVKSRNLLPSEKIPALE